jgi:hypothetical protein
MQVKARETKSRANCVWAAALPIVRPPNEPAPNDRGFAKISVGA